MPAFAAPPAAQTMHFSKAPQNKAARGDTARKTNQRSWPDSAVFPVRYQPAGNVRAPGEDTTEYQVPLEPPGPQRLFRLESEADFLRHPEDPRDERIFQPKVPVDEFVLKFRKPN